AGGRNDGAEVRLVAALDRVDRLEYGQLRNRDESSLVKRGRVRDTDGDRVPVENHVGPRDDRCGEESYGGGDCAEGFHHGPTLVLPPAGVSGKGQGFPTFPPRRHQA